MAAEAEFEIGIATADITPPVGIPLAGYGPRKGKASEEVGHRLRAEAMVVRGEGDAWALLTSDFISYSAEIVAEARKKVAEATGLAPEAILISGTHTHSGPALRGELEGEPAEYKASVPDKLAQVIIDAYGNMAPGSFEAAMTYAPELAHNRRVVQADGSVQNDWLDEEGQHSGYFDPTVLLIGVRRPDGDLDALIVNYGCHPVTLGPRSLAISADYPGYVKDHLENEGAARTVMFALAGAGNINPRVCIQVGKEYPQAMGESLAKKVQAALGEMKPLASGTVASGRAALSFVSERSRRRDPDREEDEPKETEIMALRAGGLGAVSLPGELFSQYAQKLREISPTAKTLVISLANDSVGYLPVDAALPQGGHEVNHRGAVDGIEKPIMDAAESAFAQVAE